MIGCFKQGLLVHPSKSMEDKGAESDMDYRDPDGGFQRGRILATGLDTILITFS